MPSDNARRAEHSFQLDGLAWSENARQAEHMALRDVTGRMEVKVDRLAGIVEALNTRQEQDWARETRHRERMEEFMERLDNAGVMAGALERTADDAETTRERVEALNTRQEQDWARETGHRERMEEFMERLDNAGLVVAWMPFPLASPSNRMALPMHASTALRALRAPLTLPLHTTLHRSQEARTSKTLFNRPNATCGTQPIQGVARCSVRSTKAKRVGYRGLCTKYYSGMDVGDHPGADRAMGIGMPKGTTPEVGYVLEGTIPKAPLAIYSEMPHWKMLHSRVNRKPTNKSQEQTSTSTSNPKQEAIKQDQSVERRFEALAGMASTPKGPEPGAPPSRAPAPTVPAPGTFRSPAPAPGTSLVPGLAQATAAAPPRGTVTAGLVPPPGVSWQLPAGPTTPTGSWNQLPGTVSANPAPSPLPTWQRPGGASHAPTTQAAPAAGTNPPAQSSSRSRKRVARIVDRASSHMQSNRPASTLPVPNPCANTLPADYRRNANPNRDKTPDADFTIDELQQDQVFSVPTSSIEGMGRVVAYQKIGFGRSVIVGIGPNRFCKYRIRPARDYCIGRYKSDIPLVTPRPNAHGRGFTLAGIAYADKGDAGTACLNPGTRLMPRTYIKVKWDDGTPDTWEMRTRLRTLMGKAMVVQAIFDSASQFEWDARVFMDNHPGWDQGYLVTVKREPGVEQDEASNDEDTGL
ncbi:hypothetical protein HOY82DRAFT_646204 [Tuber indicum]|nr:hypothetical protein HOY82DRAFT_646204 [Tuber indicum]